MHARPLPAVCDAERLLSERRESDMASPEGQAKYDQYRRLYKEGKKKEAFEIARTLRGNPDMLMFQGRGGFAFGSSGKEIYVGNAGESHFDLYMRTYAKGDAGKANDLVRNSRWVNGRVSDAGETVMLWGSPREIPQQALSNTLPRLDFAEEGYQGRDREVLVW